MTVAHGPLELRIERVVEANHGQIGVDGKLAESGKTDGIQTIALRGIIALRHKGPELADGRRHAHTAGIARARASRAAEAGNVARLQEIAGGVAGAVLEAKNALP